MATKIVSLAHRHEATAIATPGPTGYDGHPDHIQVHQAALLAQAAIWREQGVSVPVLALNADHQGEFSVPVDPEEKLAELAQHSSQMLIRPNGQIDPDFWESRRKYHPLFENETYDIHLP